MSSKVLITGASGFSGSHLSQYLVDKGYDVIVHLGRTPIESIPNLKAQRYFGSLSQLQTAPKVDVIVHLAASSPADHIFSSDIVDNVMATSDVIYYAKKANVKKIIYFSSISLYGRINSPVLYEESNIVRPDLYGISKLMCEKLLEESGIPTVSLRLPGIVGKGARRNWLSRLVQASKEQKEVAIFNPGAIFNNIVHIDFMCELVNTLIKESITKTFKPLLVASEKHMRIKDVVLAVMKKPDLIITKRDAEKRSFVISTLELSKVITPWSTQVSLYKYLEDEGLL